MSLDIFQRMKDLGQYVQLGLNKGVMPALGRGVDYTEPKYKDLVSQIVARHHPRKMQLKLTEIIEETPSTKTFRFQRLDGPNPMFRPGQYINLHLDVHNVHTSRPYSISSAPDSGHLDLTIRDKDNGFVAPHLHEYARVGQEYESSAPRGNFAHEPLIDGSDLVFIAGGSGITPFMSIIRDQVQKDWPLTVQLIYGCRIPTDVIFGRELTRLARKHKNFKHSLVISEPPKNYRGGKGLIDAAAIKRRVKPLDGKTCYICGPGAMYDLTLAALIELGVPRHKIKRELYGPPEDVTTNPAWPEDVAFDTIFSVEVDGSKTIKVRAGEPLANSLERHGLESRAVCRSGECSACRIQILSGDVFIPDDSGVRESDRTFGYAHACVTYPLSDLIIRI